MGEGRKHFLGGHIGEPRSHFLSRVMRRHENVGTLVSDPDLHPRDPPLLSEWSRSILGSLKGKVGGMGVRDRVMVKGGGQAWE